VIDSTGKVARVVAAAILVLGVGLPSYAAAPAGPAVEAQARAIDEGLFLDINGIEQWVTIRGQDQRNPVLLILHGGPGMGMSNLAPFFADWEKTFTVVQWDQPRSGATDLKNLDTDKQPATIARYKRDAFAVTETVLARLQARKLVLFGNSWGSLLGLEMIHERPELFSAYVGTSQAVGGKGNVQGYEMALSAARERNDDFAIAALEKVGPPPYEKFEDFLVRQQYSNPPAMPATALETAASTELGKIMATPPATGARYVAPVAPPQGYDFWARFLQVQSMTFRETWAWDAKNLGKKFAVPMFVYQGEVDVNTPLPATREWFEGVRAPKKTFEVIAGASHNTIAFAPKILELMNRDVLPVVSGERVARR